MSDQDVAVITGGAGGMGLATAKILGRDHRLVISDVSDERLERAAAELADLGISSTTVVCDVADAASVENLFEVASGLGPISACVHTAGVSPSMGDAETILRINALGTVHVTEAFLANAAKGAALVNVASMAAYLAPGSLMPRGAYGLARFDPEKLVPKMLSRVNRFPGASRSAMAYSISKDFVIRYSRDVAGMLGLRGLRVVSVSPGSFDTDMGRLEEKKGAGKMVEFAAIKRFGTADEIAEVLAFCASDKAGYLTGTDILVDGGTVAGITIKDRVNLALGRV